MTARQHFGRFPAYGKQLMQQRLAGRVPRSLYVVTDWNLAKAFPRVVVTDDIAPDQLELCFLAGLDITLAYRERYASRVPELMQKILAANPRILNALAVDIPQNTIIKNRSGEVML
jgi:hypothetical protein